MKLTRIAIDGFGCLSDFSVDLAPGLHIFFGPNEAGKSTLQQAILALMYGFYASDNVKRRETALHDRFRPWSDSRYSGLMEYRLQNGSAFRVQRDFSVSDVPTTVWDLSVGKDATDEFGRGRRGNVPFMVKQLGMPKGVFETCAFVSQGEIFEITGENRASPQEIGDTIVSLADTGRRDVSARLAIERLEKVLREQVGTKQARTTPLPVVRNKLRDVERELEDIKSVQAEVAQEAAELERAGDECRRQGEEIRRTRYLIAVVEAAELEKRIDGLKGLDAAQEELNTNVIELRGFAAFPVEERDRILQLAARTGDARRRVELREGETEALRPRLAEITARREALSLRQANARSAEKFSVERKAEVDRLVDEWKSARVIAGETCARRDSAAAMAQHLVPEFETLEREVGSLTQADRQRLLAELQAPGDRTGTRAVTLVRRALAWLLLALPRLAWWIVSRLRGAPSQAAERGDVAAPAIAGDPVGLLEKHSRYQEIGPLVRKLREEQAAVEASEQRVTSAADRASAALIGVVDIGGGVEDAYEAFCRGVDLAGEARLVDSQLQAIENERRAVTAAITEYEADVERAASLERNLVQELEGLIGREGPLSELVEAFEAACRQREAYDRAKRSLAEIEGKRELLLRGRSCTELDQMLANREAEKGVVLAEAPHLEGAQTNEPWQALRDCRDRQQEELQALEVRMAELKTAIDSRLRGLRPRAEVEEDIERHRQDLESLERFGKALAIAVEVAGEAMREAHRDFAPRVGGLLSEGLEHITGGRYVKAYLDPGTFRVTTEVPETGRLEDVELLSQGTRAAAYALLRVGLAQHMSSMSEPVPIILDDPLVDLDDVRLEKLLELLAEVSKDAQILLFTKDEATRKWFNRTCVGVQEHALTELRRTGMTVDVARPLP